MEDISGLPAWQPEQVLAALRENPLTIKVLKVKLQKIYMINSYTEREHLCDVVDAYNWIKLANHLPVVDPMFESDKVLKFFIEEFVFTSIKYMVLCRSFKMLEMMIYTQQLMVQGLRIFKKFFYQLQKYPRLTLILKHTFDYEKQFFKVNYTNYYHILGVNPTKEEIEKANDFTKQLKTGDRLDVFRTDHHSKRVCWLPGTFKKSSVSYMYVRCDNEKTSISLENSTLQVRPYQSMRHEYEWRWELKVGDKVDYMRDIHSWVQTEVLEVEETTDMDDETIKYRAIKLAEDNEYVPISDARIQKLGAVTRPRPDGRLECEFIQEDYIDYIVDPEMKQMFFTRSETSRSLLVMDLLSFAHKQLDLFNLIAKTVREKSMKIEVVSELIGFVFITNSFFHRHFAVGFLLEFTESILEYINNSKEGTIRNFSKERYEAVISSIQEFLKRLYPVAERKQKIEKLQLDLILRFLFSDFLDRKLQAVSLMTSFFKMSKHNISNTTHKQFVMWVRENKILATIYHDKSHFELISKSSDFLKYYLETEPPIEELQPLLIWNEAIIKLVNENFDDLPREIQGVIVQKIKAKGNVTNQDALSIIKKTPNCEAWLLQNGGDCWVEVVKEKTKRKAEIAEVFKQPFPVINKITKEMNELYDGNFKTTYFSHMFEINYLCTLLEDTAISLSDKLDFISMATQLIKKITDQLFQLLLKLLVQHNSDDQVAEKYHKFFIKVMPKLQNHHLKRLFEEKFSSEEQLDNITATQFMIFFKCFIEVNHNIQEHKTSEYLGNGKRFVKTVYNLRGNITELFGIERLERIIFHNKSHQISDNAIVFIGDLLSQSDDAEMASDYKKKLLQSSLQLLYSVNESEVSPQKAQQLQKCLVVLSQVMNLTETEGVDEVPSVHALFPPENIQIRLVDNFNTIRSKVLLHVQSNKTLFQFRSQLCKHINAYVHETKLMLNGVEVHPRYNGQVIRIINFDGDLSIEKVAEIPKTNLTDQQGCLVEKAKIIFRNLFKEYSSFGLMSKKQCLKYHQKCVGETMSQGETKVDKIFEQYDKDKDGYLTEADFLSFYENSAKVKESQVWSNLQAFGVRNDLQILDSLPIVYPERQVLARNKLYDDEAFMSVLFNLLSSTEDELAKEAWKVAARLPLYEKFNIELDLCKQYLTRYWLYVVEQRQQFHKVTKQILVAILDKMELLTVCIGLKIAYQCPSIEPDVLQKIMHFMENHKPKQANQNVEFFLKVILDLSLKIFSKFVIKDPKIAELYIQNSEKYNKTFRQGIMSSNAVYRQKFCHTLSQLIEESIEKDFKLFESLFNLIYRIFDNCDLSTLTMQYFELFSNLLTILKQHGDLLAKLGLNWGEFTQEIIKIYKSHECTETSMTSKPDEVAEGLLKIITRLLNAETIDCIVELVPFIFQQSLFPENGRNKLKTSKSRQDAYSLVYEICNYRDPQGNLSNGLEKLFEAGFKEIYKKMSAKKSSEIFSYYYSYNQSRSQLGYAGIRNLGCICYMISMLQQLYMTAPFRNLILIAEDNEPQCLVKKGMKEVDDNLFHQMKNMFSYLLLTEKQEYNPEDFCFAFKDFEGMPVNTSIQQDAQEFLNIFFDKLETSLKNTPFRFIFENVFGGKSCSQMRCLGCGAIKERTQNFYPLSLEIKGFKTINESFRKYIEGESISDYQCDSCNNKCDVIKRNFLEKTPNYFIIHLQRMCFNYDRLENEKVNSRWEFPHNLNVYDYTLAKQKGIPEQDGQFTYTLKGIVVHYGTADFGHYFSYIKESDSQWIEFNDERVREFDPSDIEIECFGGEHWRRESQSAYLLVYEREKKSGITLEFSSEAEKTKLIEQFKLKNAIIQEIREPNNQSESQVSRIDSVAEDASETKSNKDKEEETQIEKEKESEDKKQEGQNQSKEQEKIKVHLDMRKINQLVPKAIKDKIDEENDQFSFTMNLSNNQFAAFIYHILSINPPLSLKGEYLELCYECLHLKQTIKLDGGKSVNVAEWAAGRFTELIEGNGWQFLKNLGQSWESEILNIEKSTRNVTKCLMQSVVTDIIRANKLNEEMEGQDQIDAEKRNAILKFLDRLTEMMLDEVVRNWVRFAEYFELWINLVRDNAFVRRYCEEKMIVEKILEFVMESGFPYQRTGKRMQMGNQYYGAEFEYPLQFMYTLLKNGYELNEMEQNCLRAYAFMDKIICYKFEGDNMIETLCKNNVIISEKMGYLLLSKCSSVQQSDQVKPIIASIHEYLRIADDLQKKRIEWIIGFPVYVEQSREKGFGSFGCVPSTDAAVIFESALGQVPILQQIQKFKKKTPHVAILLISMVLQMESDGHINNLDEYPAKLPVERTYTHDFQQIINPYYEETQRPYTVRHYTEYGQRAKMLWEERPNRPMLDPFPQVLLGKVIEEVLVKEELVQDIFEIRQTNIKVYYLPLDGPETSSLSGKNITQIKNNGKFVSTNMPKPSTARFYGSYSVKVNSSDEEDNEECPTQAVFDNTKEGFILKKVEIHNKSDEDMLCVMSIAQDEETNLHLPTSPLSIQIESNTRTSYVLIKRDLEKGYTDLDISLKILGKATTSGYMPRQIITEADQKPECTSKPVSSDEEDDELSIDNI